jgi:hypothetical protein
LAAGSVLVVFGSERIRNMGEGMFRNLTLALLVCSAAVLAVQATRAGDCCAPACAPKFRTVCCTEWVCEKYPCTRTCYRTECKEECYTAYKCEMIPEVRTRTCTVMKAIPEVKTIKRCYYVCTPCCEERTIMQKHVVCKPVTKIVRKCEDHGHWECRTVCVEPNCIDRLLRRYDCCNPKTKTEKYWVPCPVIKECPVTCIEKVCEYRPCTIKCTTWKKELREECCQVTCCRYVPECKTETYTVCCPKYTPYQAVRKVAVCVPYQETYMATRMVPRTVVKQIPCDNGCCY